MLKTLQRSLLICALACTPTLLMADELGGEPEVTIIHQGDKTIEEYRINGFLYAVKVIPENGEPYFLVRADGNDGDFMHSGKPQLRIPSWKIFSW